jgi:hypothetical protein
MEVYKFSEYSAVPRRPGPPAYYELLACKVAIIMYAVGVEVSPFRLMELLVRAGVSRHFRQELHNLPAAQACKPPAALASTHQENVRCHIHTPRYSAPHFPDEDIVERHVLASSVRQLILKCGMRSMHFPDFLL